MKLFSYALLNLIFMLLAWLALQRLAPKSTPADARIRIVSLLILYFLMVIFNTYLTSLAIVRYDWQKVLGFKIISWPIEDIAYLVVALYAAPIVWRRFLTYYDRPNTPKPSSQSAAKSDRTTPRRSRRQSTR